MSFSLSAFKYGILIVNSLKTDVNILKSTRCTENSCINKFIKINPKLFPFHILLTWLIYRKGSKYGTTCLKSRRSNIHRLPQTCTILMSKSTEESILTSTLLWTWQFIFIQNWGFYQKLTWRYCIKWIYTYKIVWHI